MTHVGVVSDTHGLLRPEVSETLRGVELILHAGDVGSEAVLLGLRELAPVVAVRGNTDHGPVVGELPLREVLDVDGVTIIVVHILEDLDLDPAAVGASVVVSGHTHAPSSESRRGITYLNPGSAGPRRLSLPVSVARLTIDRGEVSVRLVPLVA